MTATPWDGVDWDLIEKLDTEGHLRGLRLKLANMPDLDERPLTSEPRYPEVALWKFHVGLGARGKPLDGRIYRGSCVHAYAAYLADVQELFASNPPT